MTPEHCPQHEDTRDRLVEAQTKVNTHEGQIQDLYKKNAAVMDLLQQIKIDTASMNARMGAFIDQYDERVKYGDQVIAARERDMEEIAKKFEEYDSFKWFRDSMNKIRDNFLVLVFGGTVLVMAGVVTGWTKIKAWLVTIP